MGHRHRKHRNNDNNSTALQTQESGNNAPNMDLGSMLQNMNLGDIDLSKIDMNKVQSMMSKMNLPGKSDNSIPNLNNIPGDQRLLLLNSLKDIFPGKKAKKLDKITKILQLTSVMNNKR